MTRQARQKKPKPSKRELADARRLKKYGVTPEWYDEQSRNGCHVCGKFPKPEGPSLHVDHDHKSHGVRITSYRSHIGKDWWAKATYNGQEFMTCWHKRGDAVAEVKRQIRRASVRGLLCWPCNRSLGRARFGGQRDDHNLMTAAAAYLARHIKNHGQGA